VWVSCTLAVLCSAAPAFAQPTQQSPPPPARTIILPAEPPQANLTVPTLHALGLMTVMRTTEAFLWPDPFGDFDRKAMGKSYRAAWTEPPKWDDDRDAFEWDGDNWYLNSVGHGLFGSELYLRARMCHLGPVGSLLFTATASAVWEYGFEATHVQPSALDLVYTPAAGIVFGEFRYQLWHMAEAVEDSTSRRVIRFLVDPLGGVQRGLSSPC
jgi:hypothetical protein